MSVPVPIHRRRGKLLEAKIEEITILEKTLQETEKKIAWQKNPFKYYNLIRTYRVTYSKQQVFLPTLCADWLRGWRNVWANERAENVV